jgi:hypothetical protein
LIIDETKIRKRKENFKDGSWKAFYEKKQLEKT